MEAVGRTLRWHPSPTGEKGPGAHGLWGMPHQFSLMGPQQGAPGVHMLQSLPEGPSRLYADQGQFPQGHLYAKSFTTVQRRRHGHGVSGAMGVRTDEPQPRRNTDGAMQGGIAAGNRFAALSQEDAKEGMNVMLEDAIKPPSRNRMRKDEKRQLCSGFKNTHCSSSSCQGCKGEGPRKVTKKKDVTREDEEMKVKEKRGEEEPIPVGRATKLSASMFSKLISGGSLMPVAQKSELETRLGRFEVMSAIVDSGATVPVMNPSTGSRYGVLAGSANGTEYEIASGDTLEDLGEKKMAVLTTEGTLKGYGSRCADVTKALQSVRALAASGHAVCFGLGDGTEHVIVNKMTGETNAMRDDGINYLQDLLIVPPEDIERVAAEIAAVNACQNWDTTGTGDQSFGWQGR